jgi:hypothetical protein
MNSPWDAEIDISKQLVRRLRDEQFTEFTACSLSLLDEGWDNARQRDIQPQSSRTPRTFFQPLPAITVVNLFLDTH